MRALITGITGFAGSHLADLLVEEGHEVWGLVRRRSPLDLVTGVLDRINLVEGDLHDQSSLRTMLRESRPEWIFHLAAQSFVPTSWRAPGDTFETNIVGQSNLFEAVRDLGIDPLIQIAGSSEEYGHVNPDELPIRESNPLRPLSPYAVSKVAQDLMGYQYHRSYGMRIIRTRAFNHTGPRRGAEFVASAFARQILDVENGHATVVKVGNLEARRDFTDVRDVVRGYRLALEKGEPGQVYNICSGDAVRMQGLLDMLVEAAGLEIEVEKDPARMRPSDVPVLEGDSARFRAATGWAPEISLERTLVDLLEWWRSK